MKACGHTDFGSLCKRLLAEGRKFTLDEMRKLCYGDLILSTIGNAGKAIGRSKDRDAVEKERLDRFRGLSPDALATATFCDDSEAYEAFQRLANDLGPLPDDEASPEILLYRNMIRLRGDWSGGRSSRYLTEIYRLIDVCKHRGELPIAWLAAVKLNADTFDGHFNDGRIMRDGGYHLPEETVKALGLPAEMARGCSGNIAKTLGAVPNKEGGYRGSYEELWERILSPEQRIEFMRLATEEDHDI